MKTTMTFKSITLIALLGAVMAVPVLAQGGPGMGGGPGMWNGAPGSGAGMVPGAGMDQGGRGGRSGRAMTFNQNNTRGWTLMTPEERTAYQIKMREVKTYDECKLTQTEHRTAMETRAKEKGVTLQAPRRNVCDNLKAGGVIK